MARTQFVVPQFLDVEPRIFSVITIRQFCIMLAVILSEFIIYKLFNSLAVMLLVGLPLAAVGAGFAFLKVNGQALHFIALNFIQTMRKPAKRIWDKTISDSDLRELFKKPPAIVPEPKLYKAPLVSSRLKELSLVVNTGGVYKGDNDQLYG